MGVLIHNESPTILGSILEPPDCWKLPCCNDERLLSTNHGRETPLPSM